MCKYCGATFASTGTARMHERTVHLGHNRYSKDNLEIKKEENVLEISELDEPTTLIMNKKILKKDFQCQICNKGFVDNYKLKRHQQIHVKSEDSTNLTVQQKDKPMNFTCQICHKSFSDNWKLNRHENIHIKSGELLKPSDIPLEKLEPFEEIIDSEKLSS